MTHLVTGCAGFIASRTADELLSRGREVVGVDNLGPTYDPTLKRWRLDQLQDRDGFTFHHEDVEDLDAMRAIFENHDLEAVLNLAARAGVRKSVENPWGFMDTNATGMLNLLELCRQHDVPTCLLASTSSLYGDSHEVPFSEDADTDAPVSPYAASKKAAESLAASYSRLYGIATPSPRYFTVYGPAGRPDMSVFRFVRWVRDGEPITVYGDGTQRRDFTYVGDIARGTIAALELDGFEPVNLGNDDPVALNDLIALIEDAVGREARTRHDDRHPADVDATWADISKARELLDWEPQVGLREGLQRTADWYEANREWAQKVELGEV